MRIYKQKLKSGLRVLVSPVKDTKTVTVFVFVSAGSEYESKNNNGVSHFLEHLCFKGTEAYPTPSSLSHAFDALGAENNAFTSEEYTGYYAKVHTRHFDKILKLISGIYLSPKFDSDEVNRERGVVIEEINLYNDQPTWHAHDVLTNLLYGNQPAGWDILGTKENIKTISRESIMKYRKQHYVARGTAVVVVGNVSTHDVVRKVEKYFSDISRGRKTAKKPVKDIQKSPQVGVRYKKTDQAHIMLGIRSVPFGNKEIPALSVLTTLLGGGMSSRLFSRMRDELGICYYVNASHNLFIDHGYLSISAGVACSRVEEAVHEILDVCKNLRDIPVSIRELNKAKNYFVGTMYLHFEATDALAWSYGAQEMLSGNVNTPAQNAQKIRSVTINDIRRVANLIFQKKNINLAVVGPYKNKGRFSRILHL